jgi:hypothetical protein
MPAIQTSYPLYQAEFTEGAIPDQRPRTVASKLVETAAGIGFGKAVIRGTADNQIKVSAAGGSLLGITVVDNTQVATAADVYPQYATAAVMQKGPVVVIASVAVADGDPVYVVPATGLFTNVATGNTAIPNAVFERTTTAANQLTVVYLG